jgi:SpoVK/Ycf46/Vps4 family AAA+-type ATPase
MTTSAWPERLTCRRDWTDIELPDPAIAELRAALDGRREPSTRSRRTSASTDGPRASVFLLLGPDRAQKRIVAEAVARQLRVDLYRVDLSAVLSKWIGDTGRYLVRSRRARTCGPAL